MAIPSQDVPERVPLLELQQVLELQDHDLIREGGLQLNKISAELWPNGLYPLPVATLT